MTNVEQLVAEMELSPEARQRLAERLAALEQLDAICRRHARRLPHQVQTALRRGLVVVDRDAPAEGVPGLPLGRTA